MSIKDRLIQFILRGKDELSPEALKSSEALEGVRNKSQSLRTELDKAKGAQGLVGAFRATSDAAERTQRTLERTEKRASELRGELDKNPDSKGLQVSLRETEKEAARAARQLDKLTAETQAVEKAAKNAGVDTNKLADEERRLANEVDEARRALKDNTSELRTLERQQRSATRSADEYQRTVQGVRTGVSDATVRFGKWLISIYLVDKALQGLSAGAGYVRDGIVAMLSTGDQFEGMQTQLTALMGSIEGGERATEWIKQFTRDTPLQLQDVTEAFTLLKAFGLDPMDGTLQAITDQSEKLGGGMEKLTGISSALGQAWAKQKLQGEEILQLVERGVPVWDLLEKVTGKNTEQLQKLSSAGKLGRDVISDLIKEIGEAAEGSAAANMTRLTGIVSNLRDVAADFLDRIAKSGALDYVKRQLLDVGNAIAGMDRDGRLDALAKSLSNAFIQGAERVKAFARELGAIDFNQLVDDSTAWFNTFGKRIDDLTSKVELFTRPLRTGTNLVTSFLSGFVTVLTYTLSKSLGVIGAFASAIPEMLGGEKVQAAVAKARKVLDGLTDGAADQFKQDMADIRNTWTSGADAVAEAQGDVTDAVADSVEQQRMMNQALADGLVNNQQRVKDAAIDAAIAGTEAIAGFAEAQKLIDTASTVAQLEGLRAAMLRAYQDGAITQQEYAAGLGIVADKLDAIAGEADKTAKSLSDVIAELEDFAGVQKAIGNAKTDVDIGKLRSAITKLYEDGKLTVDEYTKAVANLDKQQAKLTKSTGDQADAQSNLEKQLQSVSDALAAQAGAEAAAASAREEQKAMFRDAFSTFFDGVMTAARSPLAELSDKALEAFDSLRGISNVDIDLDTSSLEGTAASLAIVNENLADLQSGLDDQFRGPFARWADETLFASGQLQKRFLEQKQSLQQLMERYDRGSISLASFQVAAHGAKAGLDLLDGSDFSALNSALDSVKQKMEAVGESARNTLGGVRDELDKLRGNEEAIERRRMQSRQRELQAQIAEARGAGNAAAVQDLQQALGMLRSIQSETELARETAAREQRRDAAASNAPAAAQATQPTKIIRLESARGAGVDVAVPAGQEDALLGILEQAGLRSM